jgi:hypothetical protein
LPIEDVSTVVLVSLEQNKSGLFWPKAEACAKREMDLYDDIDVSVVVATSDDESDFQTELRAVAERFNAVASILVYKTDNQNARLLLYMKDRKNNYKMFKEWDFLITQAQLEADEAALTAVDAIRSLLEYNEKEEPPPPRPFAKYKAALSLAISGAVTLGIGGVLHWQKIEHEHEANRISEDMWNYYDSGVPPRLKALRPLFDKEERKAKAFRIGAIVSYSIGGALIAAGVVLFSLDLSRREERASFKPLSLRGTAIVWEF